MATVVAMLIACMQRGCNVEEFVQVDDNIFLTGSRLCYAMARVHKFGLDLPFVDTIEKDLAKLSMIWHSPTGQMTDFPMAEASEEIAKKFNESNPTIIIIHGFNSEPYSFDELARAFHKKGDYNVLLFDASDVIKNNYFHAVAMVGPISESLSDFILEMKRLDLKKVHLISVSLGAHIAGQTAKNVLKKTGKKLGRVSGLDPAGPCYSGTNIENVLNKKDAVFVDLIHSNKGVQGMLEALGHVDFYPNGGGPNQPGCTKSVCSHMRSYELFLESLDNPESLLGRYCTSWSEFTAGKCNDGDVLSLGQDVDLKARGVYYLKTSSNYPYGMGQGGITVS